MNTFVVLQNISSIGMISSSMLVMIGHVREISTNLLCLHQRIFCKSVLYKYCGRCGLGLFGRW